MLWLSPHIYSFSEIADLMSLSTKLVHRERTRKLKKAIDSDTKGVDTDVREEMFNTHPELLVNLGQSLFSVLVDMFASTVNPSVRYKCLSSITKILYFSTADMLKDLLRVLWLFLGTIIDYFLEFSVLQFFGGAVSFS